MPRALVFAASGLILLASFAQGQGICLPIEDVRVDDANILGTTTVDAIVAPYEGRCLDISVLDTILERLTLAYVDRGYILSRAYLPEQDLTDGQLLVKVVEGGLSEIRINRITQPLWSGVLFPGLIGKPVNIREIEQGLDQIEAMPRWEAQLEFDAGVQPGQSELDVAAATSKPYEVKVTTNNRGNEQTGEWNTALSGDFTNVMGMNDTWTWNVSRSVGPGPLSFGHLEDGNRSAGYEVTLPYGNWSWSFGYNWSDYRLTIPGAISPIVTDGWSRTQTLSTKYLTYRDQTTKEYFSATLKRSQNENFIADVSIDNSSRILTGLKLEYAVSTPMAGGSFDGSFYVEKGLPWFGAERVEHQPAGSPNAQYRLVGFSVDYARSLGEGGNDFRWTSTASGQYSPNRLYGGQNFSIGGVSTVRGSKIALASGSSGLLWRNELEYTLPQTAFDSVALYGALDLGHVSAQPELDIRKATALGHAIGVKMRDDLFTLDLSYQKTLSVSKGLQQPDGQFFVEFEIIF
jgi:hemolysin activation/secretion protein